MYKEDINTIKKNSDRIVNKMKQISEKAKTLEESGFSPTNSDKIAEEQEAALKEVAQLVANVNELLSKAEKIEIKEPEYFPKISDVAYITNSDTENLEIIWTAEQTPVSNIKVTKNGTDITNFSDPISPSEKMQTSLTSNDTVKITVYGSLVNQRAVDLHSWDSLSITGSNSSLDVNLTDVQLPENTLVPETREYSVKVTL